MLTKHRTFGQLTRLAWLLMLLITLGCGGGGGGGQVSPASDAPASGGGGQPIPRAQANVTLRVPARTPGAAPLAWETPSRWNPLRWFSQPALAQSFYTLPGARVDAIGNGFTFADSQGVARFFGLNPGESRFAVSTAIPGVVFQTLATLQAGATISPRLDEFTTLATLLATSAAQASNTSATDADLMALAAAVENNLTPELASLRSLVESRWTGSAAWLNVQTFLPLEQELLDALEAANDSVSYKVAQVPLRGQAVPTADAIILSFTFNKPVDPTTLPGLGAQNWSLTSSAGQVINAANLQAMGGSVHYSGPEGSDGDGRAYPSNTFAFRLPGSSVPAGTDLEYTLSMQELPKDLQGRSVLASRPTSTYAVWTFTAYGPGLPGAYVESNVTGHLDFQASACLGATEANLSPLGEPTLLLSQFDLSGYSFDYYQGPDLDRVLLVRLRPTEPLEIGVPYAVGRESEAYPQVAYEERYATGDRRFWAREGTVTILSVTDRTVVARADVTMEAVDEQGRPLSSGESFCLQAQMTSVFP